MSLFAPLNWFPCRMSKAVKISTTAGDFRMASLCSCRQRLPFLLGLVSWQANSGAAAMFEAFSLLFSPTWVNPDRTEETWGQLNLTKIWERCFPVKIHGNSVTNFRLNSQSVLQSWWKSVLYQSRRWLRLDSLGTLLHIMEKVMAKNNYIA